MKAHKIVKPVGCAASDFFRVLVTSRHVSRSRSTISIYIPDASESLSLVNDAKDRVNYRLLSSIFVRLATTDSDAGKHTGANTGPILGGDMLTMPDMLYYISSLNSAFEAACMDSFSPKRQKLDDLSPCLAKAFSQSVAKCPPRPTYLPSRLPIDHNFNSAGSRLITGLRTSELLKLELE